MSAFWRRHGTLSEHIYSGRGHSINMDELRDVQRFLDEMGAKGRFTLLAQANGNRLDYDHINMLTAPQAQEDHFPAIAEWLKAPPAR